VVILRDTGEGGVTGNGQWSFCVTQVRDVSREKASGHFA